ncbi:hypothetical protein SAMD00019534_019300 [Acytostelium subglobosum LB1]|uniref:hypothetical protein n=1 Tax=Acytostelium subglobosum LB1 TaxID=1410327 RepID=UPI00064503D9|nr:hypothetical protein SAMD00019534_031370 [Acytostelium subglobosum LB1]XP_012757975.1 hypothetical protein SAMD00019534_019300 [Acytostelium subglobosum LB1]GAM18755.1 hypothetical protein SAMD00019534_019300 [Acytostelium subglobosum LB1]GAM19962.1 hypothetical protein SAMD00019534_031370 [Acytostelium subglobosum LB1]|eukprot:XP_012756724.1 hypothetical protein SAMD00019534_031370 [Acytostelium subglobosum LB1]
MAKAKNHSTHHQNSKEHRNGIKKPIVHRKTSSKGMDTKFVRNQKFARVGVKAKRYVRGDLQEQKPHKNPRKSAKAIVSELKAKQAAAKK